MTSRTPLTKRAKSKLESSPTFPATVFREFFATSPDGFLLIDAQSGAIAEANQSALELLGRERRSLIGKETNDIKPLHDLVQSFPHPWPSGHDATLRAGAFDLTRKDGTKRTVEALCSQFSLDGRTFLQCSLRDNSPRLHDEEKIRRHNEHLEQRVADRTAELEAANRELEAFSYSVSHDLRAPLRHIMGFVEILQRDAAGKLLPAQVHLLDNVATAAHRMSELIDDLLAFSRIGRSELRKTTVDMGALTATALADLKAETKDRDIEWVIHPLPAVEADRSLMRQALVNLISNALKFTKPKLKSRIEIGSSTLNPSETVFFVRDNGIGFDPRYTHKLFGVFQRLHNADEFEGTGIGLANVQQIIRRHGGHVWAEGKPEEGATFYFALPTRHSDQP